MAKNRSNQPNKPFLRFYLTVTEHEIVFYKCTPAQKPTPQTESPVERESRGARVPWCESPPEREAPERESPERESQKFVEKKF